MAIFFDMDGTLHRQDSFVEFLLFSAKSRPMVTFILSPIIFVAMVIYAIFPKGKLGINIMLAALLFGFDKPTLDKHIANFAHYFNKQATILKRYTNNYTPTIKTIKRFLSSQAHQSRLPMPFILPYLICPMCI